MMRPWTKPMLVLILLCTIGVPSLYGATAEDFVGRWNGDVSVVSPNESEVISLTMILTEKNGVIFGTATDNQTVSPQPFQGTINNGVLTFKFPNMGPGDPDCANWDVTAAAALNQEGNTMHLDASGIICSQNGGEAGSFSGDLIKEKSSLQPILSILLKDRDSDWFFSGTDVGGAHSWYGSTTLSQSGKLLNGTLHSSSGSTYTFVNGQLNTRSTGEVTGLLTDSDSTTTSFSMQLNGHKNIMAGGGRAVGESENGLFIFVKKSTDAQSTDLSDQWFLSYSDLVANRACGGTITFTGFHAPDDSWRIPSGTVDCTDGTSHSIQGGTLYAFFVNDPVYTHGPGNVNGSFYEPDNQGRVTQLQLELNVREKIMVGYGKGTSDSENGLYIFTKKTTNASATDLAGDWFASVSDLWGNKTWTGLFHFNSSGEFITGSLTNSQGDTWTFTDGTFSVDSSGKITGTLTDTGPSDNIFVMQLNESKDIMVGPASATTSHDNGLLLMVKK